MRLCFGSYFAVLVSCKAVNVDNKQLCEVLLHSVAPNFEFTFSGQENADRVREDASSKLLRCEQNLSKDVTDPARHANPQEVAAYFKDNVLKLLDSNLFKQIVLALRDIIASDTPEEVGKKIYGIYDDTKVEMVSGTTKMELSSQTEFSFHTFLAGVFLYVVTNTENRSGKKTIKLITQEYVFSFTSHIEEIILLVNDGSNRVNLVSGLMENRTDAEFAEDVAGYVVDRIKQLAPLPKQDDSLLVTLLAEANGKCLYCGDYLGIPKRGKIPVKKCEIVHLKLSPDEAESYENAVALCANECAPLVPTMSSEEIKDLLERKQRCADLQAFLDRISGIKFQSEIEAVLREVHKMKNAKGLEPTNIKDLVEIERKIHEPFLKDKINASMARLYKTVKETCSRLEQEIGFDTNIFGELMKSASILLESGIQQKPDIVDPQEYIMDLLVEKLYSQVGQRYKDACEIIVGYLVKRCDLFNENAKQS